MVAPRYRPRQLWQVPMFFFGLMLLAGVGLARPLWHHADGDPLDLDLASARQMLHEPDCSIQRLQNRLQRVLAAAQRSPHEAGEAHLLLGTAYLCQADKAPPTAAAQERKQARSHLEKAETLGVPEAEELHLLYRLGKVWYQDQAEPQRVLSYLERSVENAADDPAEGYAMLTRAYLRLPEPDVQAALEANRKQLQLPTLREEILAPARLMRGELLLRLGRPAEAREVLKFIKSPAAPEIVAKARCLQARTFQNEEHWTEAARLWQEALAEGTLPSADAGTDRYYLGICLQHLERRPEAIKAWEQARKDAGGEAALAAALALAELRLQDTNPQRALDDFRWVVQHAPPATNWHNPFVDLVKARETCERGCVIYHALGRYEQAMELASLYENLAVPGQAQGFYAQSAEAAARARLELADKAASKEARHKLEESARTLFRDAGRRYEAALAAAATPSEQAERLWHSAECSMKGQDYAAEIPVLEHWLKVAPSSDHVGEAWFHLAEARRALHQDDAALVAFSESLKRPGPFSFRARYELAMAALARGEWDQASDELELNLKLLRAQPDCEAHEKSLYEMGGLLYRRHNYFLATVRLEEALRLYPNSERAALGRFQAAECYRNLAGQESQNIRRPERMTPETERHFQEQYRSWLEKASKAYEQLVRTFGEQLKKGPLSESDEAIYRRSAFACAECRSNMADYRRAQELYEELSGRYHHRVEGLQALAGIAQCYWRQGSNEQAAKTLERLRKLLAEMDETAFTGSTAGWTKAEWQRWLAEVSKPVSAPP